MAKSCKINGCEAPVLGRGLCPKHYYRWQRYGDPLLVKQNHDLSPAERFWSKVNRRGPDECWEWTAKHRNSGYGVISVGGRGGRMWLAHRYSWYLTNGPIPKMKGAHGAVVRHKCDNRLCVNPAHLEIGTQADNVRDMDRRGGRVNKPPRGSRHGNAKFTEDDVLYMRASHKSNDQIAREFDCNPGTVKNIRARRSWKHI